MDKLAIVALAFASKPSQRTDVMASPKISASPLSNIDSRVSKKQSPAVPPKNITPHGSFFVAGKRTRSERRR